MAERAYCYIIIGAGLAGASAVEGIRERDTDGSILLIGRETHLPYHRPPLTKKLWFGKQKVADIFVHDEHFYRDNGAELLLDSDVVGLDPAAHTVTLAAGDRYRYGKLLLATGGEPRHLDVPGAELDKVLYYRTLDDYLRTHDSVAGGKAAVVVGGGFIGSEMAAALCVNEVDVTWIFREPYPVPRVFPEPLGRALLARFEERGVCALAGDTPIAFEPVGEGILTRTQAGEEIEADVVVAGVGIAPAAGLAENAGLAVGNGVVVDDRLRTSDSDIYAAGDDACFPYHALGGMRRIEHWDNAQNQGKHAGRNMAGTDEPFTYMPYFFSDLFEFGYEAVGDVSTRLETFADWQKENDTGVIYYLSEGRVRGAMMCNVWDQVEAARALIRKGDVVRPEDLRGAIR